LVIPTISNQHALVEHLINADLHDQIISEVKVIVFACSFPPVVVVQINSGQNVTNFVWTILHTPSKTWDCFELASRMVLSLLHAVASQQYIP
jgi:hypothetical protein